MNPIIKELLTKREIFEKVIQETDNANDFLRHTYDLIQKIHALTPAEFQAINAEIQNFDDDEFIQTLKDICTYAHIIIQTAGINMHKRDVFAYHVTETSNLESIKINGLIPLIGERSKQIGETIEGVYLFSTLSDVDNALGSWLGDEFEEDTELSILKINIKDLLIQFDINVGYEALTYERISPIHVVQVLDETYEEQGPMIEITPKEKEGVERLLEAYIDSHELFNHMLSTKSLEKDSKVTKSGIALISENQLEAHTTRAKALETFNSKIPVIHKALHKLSEDQASYLQHRINDICLDTDKSDVDTQLFYSNMRTKLSLIQLNSHPEIIDKEMQTICEM